MQAACTIVTPLHCDSLTGRRILQCNKAPPIFIRISTANF